MGGLFALSKSIGNYNAPYMTILAFLTYLPISSLVSIKCVSILFDYICAITVFKLSLLIFKDNKYRLKISLLIYSICLFLPTIFLNSAYWAQADSIYTAFILISLLYLLKQKYKLAFVFLGIAFSFKLQAIFILPLFILMYISEQKFKITYFLIPFLVNILMCIPSIIFGNTLSNCLNVYISQMGTYNEYITLNFPNLYGLLFNSSSSTLIVTDTIISKIALYFTIFIFIILAFLVYYKKIRFDNKAIIEFALWSVLICTFFLPHMHERYLYIGDILALIYLLYNKKEYYVPISIQIISLWGYIHFLFGTYGLEMKFISLLYFILIIIFSKNMYKKYFIE